jgi:hypothetical protein
VPSQIQGYSLALAYIWGNEGMVLTGYSVKVSADANRTWIWTIEGQPRPLDVKLSKGGFRSEKAAKLAGEKALRELLDGLANEAANEGRK